MLSDKYPRCLRNNNPFNIIYSRLPWIGKKNIIDNTDPGHKFEQFKTLEFGIRAGMKLILQYIFVYGLKNIDAIIRRFAPSTENHTEAYIGFVCHRTGLLPKSPILTRTDFCKLCESICMFESGYNLVGLINFKLDADSFAIWYDKFFKNVSLYKF